MPAVFGIAYGIWEWRNLADDASARLIVWIVGARGRTADAGGLRDGLVNLDPLELPLHRVADHPSGSARPPMLRQRRAPLKASTAYRLRTRLNLIFSEAGASQL